MTLTYRPAVDDADFQSLVTFLKLSFNLPEDVWPTFRSHVGPENFRGVFEGAEAVAGLAFYRTGHFLAGRAVPSAGLAAVAVAPHRRGEGASTQLLRGVLTELAAEGFPLSTLYPSTQSVYRRVGFEVSGHRTQFAVPVVGIPARPRGTPLAPLRPVDAQQHARFHGMYAAWTATQSGALLRTPGLWTRVVRVRGGNHVQAWVAGDDEGYLIAEQVETGTLKYDLALRDVVALTPRAADAFWALLAGHRTLAGRITWHGTEACPWLARLGETGVQPLAHWGWMARVLSVPGAFTARGYAPGARGGLSLAVEDDLLPANTGAWQIDIDGGEAEVRRGGAGELRLAARGLGPLLMGHLPATTLARAGLLEGAPEALTRADALLAGPRPWLNEMF